jgi:hypothetical protein
MMNNLKPEISFGIIVLNGEPFNRYCIRALYPHAHEIIIAEGACEGSRSISTTDGHSLDGTLEILRKIKEFEDPEGKITIVTAEDEGHPDGFWPGEKHEQSQAYAKRARGNYLWQVDIDEFYKDEDIILIKKILESRPEITAVSFKQIQFWGGFNYTVDSWYLRRGMDEFHRLFKWDKGYRYSNHRPPTVLNDKGQDTRTINWMGKKETSKLGIFLYHYSFVFPKQVKEKATYYKNADWSKRKEAEWWANDVFLNLSHPYSVFSIYWMPSWLGHFTKTHPKIILELINDIASGNLHIEIRKTYDIEKLLNSFKYKTGIVYYKYFDPLDTFYQGIKKRIKPVLKRILFREKK